MKTARRAIVFSCSLTAVLAASSLAADTLSPTIPRGAFIRGEEVPVAVTLPDGVKSAPITIGVVDHNLARGSATDGRATVMVPTARLSAGRHELVVRATSEGVAREAKLPITVCRAVDPHRMEVWLWSNGYAGDFYLDHGFTSAGGPYCRYFKPEHTASIRKQFDSLLERGATANAMFCGGIQRDELPGLDPATPDVAYLGAGRHAERFYNPFHPVVEAKRSEINRAMLAAFGDHPALGWCFLNTEIVDDLWLDNQNEAGAKLRAETLGFTRDERGSPKFAAPGILADDDRGYRFHKFVFTRGNGIAHANASAARVLRAARPDLRVLTDPFRQVTYTDMFPDLRYVSTWTYTNNDPKLMLGIETLRAAVRGTSQEPLQTITLLNPVKFSKPEDQFRVPRATSLAIKELSEKVFRPLGPLFTRLAVVPRDGAVLSSQASRLYNKSPNVVAGYPNEQIYPLYSVLAMTHRQADVLFDEHVERGELDRYKYLVLPKCDVITETMHARIREFIGRGGLVVADQYLGPNIPEALKVDFDFTYRPKVNADAIASGVMYAEWHDQLKPETAALAKAKGVTAEEDQKLLDSYAAQLDKKLEAAWPAVTRVDTPHVLVNELEHDGVRYLALINDHRAFDDRTGPYKAIMEGLRPIRATVSVAGEAIHPHDLVRAVPLASRRVGGRTEFEVELDALGGTLVALYPAAIDRVTVKAPPTVRRGDSCAVDVAVVDAGGGPVKGLAPVVATVSDTNGRSVECSGHHVAEDGRLRLVVAPGITDAPGRWTIRVEERASGKSAETHMQVVEEPALP